jgi:hypothetical protein
MTGKSVRTTGNYFERHMRIEARRIILAQVIQRLEIQECGGAG